MPELPDVEHLKTYFDSTSLHQTVTRISVCDNRVLEDISEKDLNTGLDGAQFESSRRYGKYLFALTGSGPVLVLHFGMTGFLAYYEERNDDDSHDRMVIDFEKGHHLAYVNQRLLGTVSLTEDIGSYIKKKDLGPDADDIDRDVFIKKIEESNAMAKSAIMDQNLIAGIGNVYADEILFQANVHPKTTASDLSGKEMKKLYSRMKHVLRVATRNQGDHERFPDTWIIPRRSEGAECPSCGGNVEKIKVSGRTGYFCSACQRR